MWSLIASLASAVLQAWGTVNHYLTFWPRLRVALVVTIWVALVAAVAFLVLRQMARRADSARRLGAGRLVFAGTLLTMVASGGGHLYTPDEWTIYAAAVGLVHHGVPAAFADEPYPLHLLAGPIRPPQPPGQEAEGDPRWAYSKYGVVPTLLAAPLYAVARLTGPGPELSAHAFPYGNWALTLVPLLFGPLVTAFTALALFDTARRLEYGQRAAAIAAGGFVFGSLAWPFSKTLMSMPLAAAFLAAALWAVVRARDVGEKAGVSGRWLAGAGTLAGLAIATRYETALFCAPLLALGAGGQAWRARLSQATWLGAGLAMAVIPLVLGMNLLRTGSPLDSGYGTEGTLTSLAEKPLYRLFGILMSPGCGLVSHTPLMALGQIGLIWLWEDAPGVAMAAGSAALLAILYYGSLNTWCGYATWGPRYLVTVGPFMALPLAALWRRVDGGVQSGGSGRQSRNPFLWLVGGAIFLWSVGTNLLAVLIDFNRGWQDHWAYGVTYIEVTWLPFFTTLTSHLRLLTREWLMDGIGGLDLYFWHVPLGSLWVGLLSAAGLACWGFVLLSPGSKIPVDEARRAAAGRGGTAAGGSGATRLERGQRRTGRRRAGTTPARS